MLGWVVRGLLVLAGMITSLFVARDALNFEIIRMIIVVFLFTLVVALIAFWPMLKKGIKHLTKRRKNL